MILVDLNEHPEFILIARNGPARFWSWTNHNAWKEINMNKAKFDPAKPAGNELPLPARLEAARQMGWRQGWDAAIAAAPPTMPEPTTVQFTGLDDTAEQQRIRLAAERAFHEVYESSSIGSRDWCLFWDGWRAGRSAK